MVRTQLLNCKLVRSGNSHCRDRAFYFFRKMQRLHILCAALAIVTTTGFNQLYAAPATGVPQRPPSAAEGVVDSTGKFTPTASNSSTPIPRSRAEAEAQLRKTLKVEQTGPHTYALGTVILDTAARTVTIPALLNQQDGLIEYALVTATGKRHESLLYTVASAEQVHLACLLLGVTPSEKRRVEVEVTWKKNGPDARYPLATLVIIRQGEVEEGQPLKGADWIYNGSYVSAAGFAAQREGSIVSLISDTAALATNPREDRRNDKIHYPNTGLLPVLNSPVQVILKFPSAEKGGGQ